MNRMKAKPRQFAPKEVSILTEEETTRIRGTALELVWTVLGP